MTKKFFIIFKGLSRKQITETFSEGESLTLSNCPIWIWPISSITSSIVYTKRINKTTKTGNSTVLWWLLWNQITLNNSNIFGISINVSEQSFPDYFFKISCYIFWVRLLWLKTIKSYYKSPLKVCELKVLVK